MLVMVDGIAFNGTVGRSGLEDLDLLLEDSTGSSDSGPGGNPLGAGL